MSAKLILVSLSLLAAALVAPDRGMIERADPPRAPIRTQGVCASCHASAEPTGGERRAAPAVFRSDRPAPESIAPSKNAAAVPSSDRGPELVMMDELVHFYGPVPFAHGIHAEMSNMEGGCENCHHQSDSAEAIQACGSCHARSPGGGSLAVPTLKGAYHRQCLGCHRDWAHENACGYCHEPRAGLSRSILATDPTDILGMPHARIAAEPVYVYRTSHEPSTIVTFHHIDHVESYGLRCVDCHQGDSCGGCHDLRPEREQTIDRIESCNRCHARNDCEFCHDRQPRPDFVHAESVGWDLEGHHADLTCTNCHGPVNDFRTPSRNCMGCHSSLQAGQIDHETMSGVPLYGSHAHYECARCHYRGDPAEEARCDGCHPDVSYPRDVPGRRGSDQ